LNAGAGSGAFAAGTISIGTTTAGAIAIGKSGITTTITGGLTQLTGAVSLTGNAASSFTTSSGALTLTAAAASTWSTTAGALTITSAAAATWSTAVGALTIVSAAALNLGTATSTAVNIGAAGITTTVNGTLVGGRQFRSQGTALVAGDVALSAEWGNTAAVGTVSGDDSRFTFTVTANGTGRAANASWVLTFKDGTWTTAPFVQVQLNGASVAADLSDPLSWTVTATTLTVTYNGGTPPAAATYTFTAIVLG
jgi:hypothetical protein